jgi:uncharacterized protein (TIGR02246 family)
MIRAQAGANARRFAPWEATMVRGFLKTILAVSVLVSISAAGSWAKAQSNPADEAAIKNLVASFNSCFNHKDAPACAALYTEDGEFTSVRGDSNHGRADVEKHYQTVFTTFLKNAQRTDKVRTVTFVTPTLASVDTDWSLTGALSPNGTEAAAAVRQGLLTWIVVKREGKWYIRVFHELDFPGK